MFSPPLVTTEMPVERKRDFITFPIGRHCVRPSANIGNVVKHESVGSFNRQYDGVVPLTVSRRADLDQMIAKHIHIVTAGGGSVPSFDAESNTGNACTTGGRISNL